MLKRIFSLTIAFVLILNFQPKASYGSTNPSYEEVETIIEEVAKEKNIPAVILKAIAWKESKYRQFNGNGNPNISYGNIGLMQINKVHTHLDQNKLRNDIKYNIEAGANILLSNWNSGPTIEDGNKDVLENWYFALWGYNGWLEKNNPNVSGNNAYQEQIFELIRSRYDQPVTSVSESVLPNSGLPSRTINVETPKPYHNINVKLTTGETTKEIQDEMPIVSRSGDRRAVFKDITNHPKRQYIEKLYEEEIINGMGDNRFAPDELITREEISKIIIQALEIKLVSEDIDINDWGKVSSWAEDYMVTMYSEGIIVGDGDNIRPRDFLTREEALLILHRAVADNEKSDIELTYSDLEEISSWSLESIKFLVESEVLDMNEQKLNPDEFVTRGEISEWIVKAINI